jgi:alpha-galactosidase
LYGDWGDECRLQRTPLPRGLTTLSNQVGRQLNSAPWFTLCGSDGRRFGQLAYSGNWSLEFFRDITGHTTVTGGIDARAFEHLLAPGESLRTPVSLLGFTPGDANSVSQALHGYQRQYAIPKPERLLPVVFDHYFPFHPHNPADDELRPLASRAAELGCEVFLLDAGWHKNELATPEQLWVEQRGDWLVNPELFPSGLSALAEHVRSEGMEFGIWMEPETVVPGAAVLRDHPNWVHQRNGEPLVARGGAHVLRLGLDEVRQWVRSQVRRVVQESAACWLKWDFNTEIGAGRNGTSKDEVLAHVEGLYQLWDEIHAEFPDLLLEACASGGGRLDLGVMAHSDVACLTDMMAPVQALGIRFGSSHAYRSHFCMNWLVHWPSAWQWMTDSDELADWSAFIEQGFATLHGDLDFRARVPMMGAFGISAPLDLWSETDVARVSHHVATYKELRSLLCNGVQYRPTDDPPRDGSGEWAAMLFNEQRRRAALFGFRLGDGAAKRTFLIPGLDDALTYSLSDDDRGHLGEASGEALRTRGIVCTLDEPFRSSLVRIEAK